MICTFLFHFSDFCCQKSLRKQHGQACLQFFNVYLNPLSDNFAKQSNTLKQFVGKLPTNCLSVFDHFVGPALKGLKDEKEIQFLEKLFKDMVYVPNFTVFKLLEKP